LCYPLSFWKSDPAAGAEQTLTIDFQQPREFGGVVLHWLENAFASRYDVEFSNDGSRWRTVRTVLEISSAGTLRISFPTARYRAALMRWEPIPCRKTTATASLSS
jgi:hypothetical protein